MKIPSKENLFGQASCLLTLSLNPFSYGSARRASLSVVESHTSEFDQRKIFHLCCSWRSRAAHKAVYPRRWVQLAPEPNMDHQTLNFCLSVHFLSSCFKKFFERLCRYWFWLFGWGVWLAILRKTLGPRPFEQEKLAFGTSVDFFYTNRKRIFHLLRIFLIYK